MLPLLFSAEMPLVVVENAAKAQSLLDKAADLRSLRCLVVIGDISEQNRAAAATTKIKLVSFQDVLVRTRTRSYETLFIVIFLKSVLCSFDFELFTAILGL